MLLYDGTDTLAKESGVSSLHAFATPRDGEATQDADELCQLVFAAVDETLGRASERVVEIAGVALSTFWHSILGVAWRGCPKPPVFTWADRRAVDATGPWTPPGSSGSGSTRPPSTEGPGASYTRAVCQRNSCG
jgi:sugar (pentulose or hexulose) kinase